jgi:hypothetical protein
MFFCRTIKFWFLVLIFPRRGQSRLILHLLVLKPPEADESQDGDDAEESREESGSTTSPPPAISEDGNLERKRKHAGDVASTSTFVMKETSGEATATKDPEPDMFELLDS